MSWFPLAGALIGLALGCVWWGADRIWPPAVAAAVVLAADLGLTGLLHIDGLIDAADGLLPHLPRERRLAVMAEPTVGAFGVAAAIAVLLLRFAALASMKPSVLLLAAIWCGTRTAMAVAARALPYARGDGLATSFRGRDWRTVALYGLLMAVALGALADGWRTAAAAGSAVAAGALVVGFAHGRLGGFTGDVLGAAGVVGETVGLLVAAAKW
jgi:adenosylcobinamide-GDP ribazoletransferase